jgi:hypothetical protein
MLRPRGGPLERGLQRVANDIPIGSLLIQPEPSTSEPLLMHYQLPTCIRERQRARDAWVIVLGSQVCRPLSHSLTGLSATHVDGSAMTVDFFYLLPTPQNDR